MNRGTGFYRKIIRRLRRFIDLIEILGVLWMKEKRYKSSLGFVKRLRAWRLGFLSDSYIQYFPTGDSSRYQLFLSDFQRWYYVPRINAKYGIILADKLLFYKNFDKFKKNIPEVFFLVKSGKLLSIEFLNVEVGSLISLIRKHKKLILKPRSGFGGRGILKATLDDDVLFLNDTAHTEQSFVEFVLSLNDYLVCQFATQKGYANEIYPEAVNTLRILTVIDPISMEARIAGLAHRFGSKTTGHVDNWTGGGLSAAVNLETGQLGECAQNPQGRPVKWIERHPDTGVAIKGTSIPEWENITIGILKMANHYKFCPYIGWDVAVTENSFWVLEANDSPDVHILQIHEPLFKKPQNRSFYQFHKVIKLSS
jgi:hypothetical protein